MTLVLEAEAALSAPASPVADARGDRADALEDVIAAHRAALLDLAPRQEERAARVEAGWHIEELGLLLRVRDTARHNATCGVGHQRRHGESNGANRTEH